MGELGRADRVSVVAEQVVRILAFTAGCALSLSGCNGTAPADVSAEIAGSSSVQKADQIDAIEAMLNRSLPRGEASVEVTAEICPKVDLRDLMKESFQIADASKTVHNHQDGNTYLTFVKPFTAFGEKELRLVADGGDLSLCRAYLVTAFL